jgi:hypothetical protein
VNIGLSYEKNARYLWDLARCGAYTMTRNATAAIKMALARNSSRLMTAAFVVVFSG